MSPPYTKNMFLVHRFMNKLVVQDTVDEKVGMHGLRVDRHNPIADNGRLANTRPEYSNRRFFRPLVFSVYPSADAGGNGRCKVLRW